MPSSTRPKVYVVDTSVLVSAPDALAQLTAGNTTLIPFPVLQELDLDAVAEGRRPDNMSADEATVYNFAAELLGTGQVSDPAYQAVIDRFGERGVMDLVGGIGYYSLVSMVLNVAQVPLPPGETPPLKPL